MNCVDMTEGHFRFLRAYLNTLPFTYVLYAAVHW